MLRKPTDLGGLGVSVAGKVFWVDGIRKSCRQSGRRIDVVSVGRQGCCNMR